MSIDKYLNEVSLIDSKIANKINELNIWREIAQGIGGTSDGERVQSNGISRKMENAVIKCVETEREIERLTKEKELFISRIERLPKRYYDIMHKMYIQGYSLTAYALKCKAKYTNATTTHSRAKKELRKVIRKLLE